MNRIVLFGGSGGLGSQLKPKLDKDYKVISLSSKDVLEAGVTVIVSAPIVPNCLIKRASNPAKNPLSPVTSIKPITTIPIVRIVLTFLLFKDFNDC